MQLSNTFGNLMGVLRRVFAHQSLFITVHVLSRPQIFTFCCFVAAPAFVLLFGWGFLLESHHSDKLTEFSALQTIIVPSSSRWAPSSRNLIARSRISPHKTIWLSLDVLIHCIVSGDVELRHPSRDLPDLLRSGVLIGGWNVHLHVHFIQRVHAILWSTIARFDPEVPLATIRHTNGAHPNLVDLDFVPHWKLKSLVRQLISSLHEGTTTSLLLTTKAPELSMFDSRYAIATLFFQPPRTTLPFTTSISTVLTLLGTYGDSISVLGAENITISYAESLFGAASTLCTDTDIRAKFIGRNSLVGWRKECLRGVWEAALLKAGLLIKWKITIKIN
ncbi:hypothetical protein B0F90DRAFT_1688731 [Multifurca ochricompacta]|uniref:Uncharacterized protein n=1 Tax=Multifurca ochricompacta TaxID=376703 RepID=A0AAD4MA72_9AGAM|nr:hypothetical protein B0F90DRAFT_1688731 [Multifurca ochricompacta]